MSPEEKADAREALSLLAGSGVTLAECVRIAMQIRGPGRVAEKSAPFGHALAEFLESVRASGRREKTVQYYEDVLVTLERDWPEIETAGLVPELLIEWIGERPTVGGRKARWRALSAFLRWGEREGLFRSQVRESVANANVLSGRHEAKEPEFLSVDDAKRVIEGVPTEVRPGVALGLFAGVRPWEIARLEWAAVDRGSKVIRVAAAVSKTGRGRIIEGLPPALWSWIGRGKGLVCGGRTARQITDACKAALGCGPWPHDALRHSFATYHVALKRDPGRTALILGHEGAPTMLYRHYRGLATKAQAERYFGLRP